MTTISALTETPAELITHLQHQTYSALTSQNVESLAYFKFILLDDALSPLSVIGEFHVPMDWSFSGEAIRSRMRNVLGEISAHTPINLYFAGREISDTETFVDVGLTYGDKVYFSLGSPGTKTVTSEKINGWSTYFRHINQTITSNPIVYMQIAENVCVKIRTSTQPEQLDQGDWARILTLRNVCGLYANTAESSFVLETAQLLTNTLSTALEISNIAGVYHLANILEWLAYMRPRMFEGFDLFEGQRARSALATALLNAVNPAHHLPPLVRMEAAWAIGWISVASQDFGHEVYQRLIEYEQDEPLLPVRVAIRSAALRSLLYPSPYYMAALSETGGWFHASVLDQNEFRRVAISSRRDEALLNFRAQLDNVLPPPSRRLRS